MKTNVKEFLEQIVIYQSFVEERALELLNAQGLEFKPRVSRVDYGYEDIDVFVEEERYTDCPDTAWVTLSIEMLQMGDAQWKKFIESATKITEQKQYALFQADEQRKLLEKHEQFVKLKEELGL